MANAMTFYELEMEFEEYEKFSCKPSFSKVKADYVFDEEKSVKWNREEVVRNNTAYDEEVKRLNTIKNTTRDNLLKELYKSMREYIGKKDITEKACETLWDKMNEHYDYPYSYVIRTHLEDWCVFAMTFLANNKPDLKKSVEKTAVKKNNV